MKILMFFGFLIFVAASAFAVEGPETFSFAVLTIGDRECNESNESKVKEYVVYKSPDVKSKQLGKISITLCSQTVQRNLLKAVTKGHKYEWTRPDGKRIEMTPDFHHMLVNEGGFNDFFSYLDCIGDGWMKFPPNPFESSVWIKVLSCNSMSERVTEKRVILKKDIEVEDLKSKAKHEFKEGEEIRLMYIKDGYLYLNKGILAPADQTDLTLEDPDVAVRYEETLKSEFAGQEVTEEIKREALNIAQGRAYGARKMHDDGYQREPHYKIKVKDFLDKDLHAPVFYRPQGY